MAEKSVTLRHVVRTQGKQAFFFYDGALTAEDGLLTIPADRPAWVHRAWRSGYTLTPDGERLSTWQEVEALIEKQNTKSVESSKTDENSNGGRQPKVEDRLRGSELQGDESLSVSGSRSDSSGSTDESVADTTAGLGPIVLDAGEASGTGRPDGNADSEDGVSGV